MTDLPSRPCGTWCFWKGGSIASAASIVTVRKTIKVLEGEGANALVRTVAYSYNVALSGVGNIFRYDSPHEDHNQEHHVHRYDVLNGDQDGIVTPILDEEQIPTLGEVIEEARIWYYDHYTALHGTG